MIDTLQIFQPIEVDAARIPARYVLTVRRHPDGSQVFCYDDRDTGYHGYGDDKHHVKYHRASLPRLLYGNNGVLIKNQAELTRGLALLQDKACELGKQCIADYHVTRADLVWHFYGDTAQFVLAHRNCRHPLVRSDPVCYSRRSMAFEGSEMRIALYDKTLERFGWKGRVVRVEIQLRGQRLKRELGDGDTRVMNLTFDRCYQAYRRILLGFEPPPIPRVSTIAEFLAIAEREGWNSGGVPAFDLYIQGMSDRNIRRLKQNMARLRPSVHHLDWSQLLPADGPPLPVELDDNGAIPQGGLE